ncbi:autotransporter assembly complex protein TamA [Neisseria wadsworthii]|uniref:Translocation and assembly module subunit TamA n=1 Tax=Neisseria wadsworthii 9715 TaxID=1030841 RepID=G4CLU7_9NEIS|nr:autotransporter assembly complex family protein [Neisseria wadsworthii]EGZ51305.1 OMP85 family outer membrane protein [Neisseria wadsworthii 9715]QMT36136.1 outer membrane protein assembly factor [Neisseria wadsworthii]
MKPHTALTLTILTLACRQAFAEPVFEPKAEDYVAVPVASHYEPEDTEGRKLEPKYPVQISSDDEEVKEMLQEHLPLITEQQQENLDKEQVGFLAEDAPNDVQTMLKTKGYFNGKVDVVPQGEGYRVDVKTGPRTQIDNVNVALAGQIVSDSELGVYYKRALADWALPVGAPFEQSGWSSSKNSVLSAVVRKKYPLAQLSKTEALINPNTNKADLSIEVDSKQPIYFGEIDITGVERYPESVARGLAQFKPGNPYDLDKLLDYQQALEQDSHYSGASVYPDFNNMQGDHVPVKVSVNEMKRQKFEMGLRYDSEYGPGIRMGYDHYNLLNRGYVGSAVFDYDKYETTVAVGISQPRKSNGKYWTSNLSYNRSTTQNLEKKALTTGVWYVRDRNGIESRLGVEHINENRRVPDTNYDLGRSAATMLTASWRRQNIETLLRPANGYYLDGKIGTSVGKLLSSTSVQRVTASAGYYFTPEEKKYGTFIARGQLGYVYARDDEEVPSTLQFRTGGAGSVRGYELDSIGLEGPNNSVLPERALAVASLEYQYPIGKDFAAAVFHDMGDVAHNFKSMNLKHGTGLGVRWFSPVAPFSFDIAYGHQDKKIRWHISLGTRF